MIPRALGLILSCLHVGALLFLMLIKYPTIRTLHLKHRIEDILLTTNQSQLAIRVENTTKLSTDSDTTIQTLMRMLSLHGLVKSKHPSHNQLWTKRLEFARLTLESASLYTQHSAQLKNIQAQTTNVLERVYVDNNQRLGIQMEMIL